MVGAAHRNKESGDDFRGDMFVKWGKLVVSKHTPADPNEGSVGRQGRRPFSPKSAKERVHEIDTGRGVRVAAAKIIVAETLNCEGYARFSRNENIDKKKKS